MLGSLGWDVVVNICSGLVHTGSQVASLRDAAVEMFPTSEVYMGVKTQSARVEQRQELTWDLQQEHDENKLNTLLPMTINIRGNICPLTLAGVATPLKGEVSSEMLYLLHTRSGMFQVTMKGRCWNSGPAVSGKEGGGSSPAAAS